jgi:hypothetical protein
MCVKFSIFRQMAVDVEAAGWECEVLKGAVLLQVAVTRDISLLKRGIVLGLATWLGARGRAGKS